MEGKTDVGRKTGLTIHDPELPAEAKRDPFQPPKKAREVVCIHCDRKFNSDEMVWYQDPDRPPDLDLELPGRGKLWVCPFADCNGAGFGCDVHTADRALAEEEYNQQGYENAVAARSDARKDRRRSEKMHRKKRKDDRKRRRKHLRLVRNRK